MRAFDDIVLVPPETRLRSFRQGRRGRASARRRTRQRRQPPRRFLGRRRRLPLETYLCLSGPGDVALGHRIHVGEWASVYAATWRGRQRLYRRFDFRSSRPDVAEILERGPDWAAVQGRSPGQTRISARAGESRDWVELTVLETAR